MNALRSIILGLALALPTFASSQCDLPNPSEAFTSCADFIIGCGNNPVEKPGCAYDVATNYNPEATIDDGSCEFNCNNDCTSDVNNDSTVSVADILILLTQFGAVCN